MIRWPFVLLLALAACTKQAEPDPEPAKTQPKPTPAKTAKKTPKKAPAKAPTKAGLPDGFEVKGKPKVEPAFLGPVPTWRFLLSQLTTWRSDARRSGQDLLVTFDEAAVHLTDRQGARRSWKLPSGLVLEQVPAHVVLQADLGTAVFRANGAQVPAADEIAIVRARAAVGGGDVEVFRLLIKGGRTFRSISTPG